MTSGTSLWQMLFDIMGNSLLIALLPLYLFSLIKGDKTDRLCVHVLAIAIVLDVTLALNQQGSGQKGLFRADQLVIDGLVLTGQIVIATRSSRRYPIVMAGAQLIIVIAEVQNAIGLIALEKTLSVLIVGATIIQLGAFALGLIVQFTWRRNSATARVFAD